MAVRWGQDSWGCSLRAWLSTYREKLKSRQGEGPGCSEPPLVRSVLL